MAFRPQGKTSSLTGEPEGSLDQRMPEHRPSSSEASVLETAFPEWASTATPGRILATEHPSVSPPSPGTNGYRRRLMPLDIISVQCHCYSRNKKHDECIVELYKHAGFFKNRREVLEKHEPQASASCVFLKYL